jgi:hypothetical protein
VSEDEGADVHEPEDLPDPDRPEDLPEDEPEDLPEDEPEDLPEDLPEPDDESEPRGGFPIKRVGRDRRRVVLNMRRRRRR